MSVGPMGMIGSVAATPLAQGKAAEDHAADQAVDQARRLDANRSAEAASGVGQTEEEAESQERDADGRRLWEHSDSKSNTDHESDSPPRRARDPSGACGQQLDLTG